MPETTKAKNLATALAKAQGEFPLVPKNGKNPHFGNEFSTLDDIQATIFPVLSKHGLSWVTRPIFNDTSPLLSYELLHESGESIRGTMKLTLQRPDMQSMGSALTYARRYALSAVCGVSTGEDDDGNGATGKEKKVVEYNEPSRDIYEDVPPVKERKKEDRISLIKHMNDLLKSSGHNTPEEASMIYQSVLSKNGPTTVGEIKQVIAHLETAHAA